MQEDTGTVITSGSAGDAAWPLVVIGGLTAMVLLLRWAFAPGRSLVQRRPQTGDPGSYGLLRPVAEPSTMIEGELQRRLLEDAGIQATLVQTTAGPRLMVFPEHVSVARALLSAGPRPPDAPG